MKGAILRRGERYYTCFSGIFSAVGQIAREYNWLVTDYENYPEELKPYERSLGKERYFWVEGETLAEIVAEEDVPWYWGVLSGFKKEVPLEEVVSHGLPYADGYSGFWKNPVSIQHPLAELELVAWDSGMCLVIGRDDPVVQNFRKAYPLSEDLEEYNRGETAVSEWDQLWEEAERRYEGLAADADSACPDGAVCRRSCGAAKKK